MSDRIIENVLGGKIKVKDLVDWLSNVNSNSEEDAVFSCSKIEFVAYYLTYLRNQTDKILQTNVQALQVLQHQSTPEKILSQRKHLRSISEPNSSEQDGKPMDSLSINNRSIKLHGSPNRDKSSQKNKTKRVKTRLFVETEQFHKSRSHEYNLNHSASSTRAGSDESKLHSEANSPIVSSTPMKNGITPSEYPALAASSPVTPIKGRSVSRHSSYNHLPKEHYERCDTPRLGHRNKNAHNDKSANSLGDYIVQANTGKSAKKKKGSSKNHSSESISDTSRDLDSSKSDLPVNTTKSNSNSLSSKKDKRRSKPTTLNNTSMRSTSLNSFNVELFQQSSVLGSEDSMTFGQPKELSKTFQTEHDLLRQEGPMLADKFSMGNNNSTPGSPSTPQIKIMNKNSFDQQNCIQADVNKITFKEKLDILIDIYDLILNNNLVLNISSEIYFLISIILSKQYEDDYLRIAADMDSHVSVNLLRSIHNSSYFAVKTLWRKRPVLELMLDKTSLKLLGENRQVRSFYPELAKFLLNLYGLKCEAEILNKDKPDELSENKFTNNVICFNYETDNIDNFPSSRSFIHFKKQRDVFYDILRWWEKPENQGGCNRSSLRTRIKFLLSLANAPANHAHLARLIRDHIIAECVKNTQVSKVCKLQKRLVGSASAAPLDFQILPKFNDREQFYRDLIMVADNESFRVHLRDAFASELLNLDATITLSDLRNHGSTSTDLSSGYLHIMKKLCILSKFLGFLSSLSYTPVDYASKTTLPLGEENLQVIPNQKILENDLLVKNYIQPPLNLIDTLLSAQVNHRLSLTIPWLVYYLAMIDYTTIRTRYFTNLLKIIFRIYQNILKYDHCTLDNIKSTSDTMKENTVIFLQLCLGWLFELPHFPHELYYEANYPCVNNIATIEVKKDMSVDYFNLVDENVLFNICGYLRELNALLLSSHSSTDQEICSFKHITPLAMTVKSACQYKSKENLIQSRLEEELIKKQPSSIRRVIEMVIDRVTSATIKELSSTLLNESQARLKSDVLLAIKQKHEYSALLMVVENIYENELKSLKSRGIEIARKSINVRTKMALEGLLAINIPRTSLEAIAKKSSFIRVSKWIDDNWSNTSIFCNNIKKELQGTLSNMFRRTRPLQHVPIEEEMPISAALIVKKFKDYLRDLMKSEPSKMEDIYQILDDAKFVCTSTSYVHSNVVKIIHQMSCDLIIICLSKQPDFMTPELIQKAELLWNIYCPDRESNKSNYESTLEEEERRDFEEDDRVPTPVTDDESTTNTLPVANTTQDTKSVEIYSNPYLKYFERTLCPRNILILNSTKHPQTYVWQKMAEYIVFLLKNNYLSEDSLTEQCLAVYRQDWSQNILENLSQCMRLVSDKWGRSSAGKFTQFLDFLAEYCNDMDYEQDISVTS